MKQFSFEAALEMTSVTDTKKIVENCSMQVDQIVRLNTIGQMCGAVNCVRMFTKEIIAQVDARLDFNDQLDLKGQRSTRLRLNRRLDRSTWVNYGLSIGIEDSTE